MIDVELNTRTVRIYNTYQELLIFFPSSSREPKILKFTQRGEIGQPYVRCVKRSDVKQAPSQFKTDETADAVVFNSLLRGFIRIVSGNG